MLSVSNSPVNFKSQIIYNSYYQKALRETRQNLSTLQNAPKGVQTQKAITSIHNDGKQDFIEFSVSNSCVYTKVNGKIEKIEKTSKKQGKAIQDAIINFAVNRGIYSDAPLCPSEKKVLKLRKELEKAEAVMYRDYMFI